ncbi:MAG: hypothetical protein N0C84_13320 [Candidatus Thiodiazotropha taylori]|uniref:Uncharacterized protein n=1 Tax=Candidatus Thiodiazotropha taylori TaxID=2792791 RepID=A0A9E4N4T2_9GAMM|nr:hypothetical protein [Candidatus Thiodiazotropha taylori]MCW4257438.1 hypothetical protein [Candidatus Thiodiazotropha taylori]
MNERIDELEKYYSPIANCDGWAKGLFFVSAILSIVIPYPSLFPYPLLEAGVKIAFVLSVIIHSVLVHFNGLYLIPRAESLRRRQLLSDAFGVPLTSEKTQLYYNNEISPSVLKLGGNVLENSFFAKNVCGEMAANERIKILIYSVLWLMAILNRSTDLSLLLTLTQVLFSSEVIIYWLKIEVLRSRNETTYDRLYSLFLNKRVSEDQNMTAGILDSFAFYEASKASASIKQSTKIFNRLNPGLTKQWEKIRVQLQL